MQHTLKQHGDYFNLKFFHRTLSLGIIGLSIGFSIFSSSKSAFAEVRLNYIQRNPAAIPAEGLSGRVESISVDGNKKIEKDAILAKIKIKTGEQISRQQIADDVNSIYTLGYFDDISVEFVSGKLTYRVKERPTITKIEFDGNDQLSSSDLKDIIKLKEYSILDPNKVKEDINLLQKHYEEKGFYLARITHETRPGKNPDEVELTYKVSDYDKVRIKKVTFINNKRFSDEKLKSYFRNTKEGGFFSWMSGSGSFKESAFKQDLQNLTVFYLSEGYLKFRHEPPVVTVSEDKKWLFITIYVDEGDQYKVGEVDFGGDLLFSKEDLIKTTGMKSGEIFSILRRQDDIQRLTEKYQDLGYAFTNVIPQMKTHDDTKIVDIRYDFEKGEIAYFGEINVIGNSKTRDKVIRRELRVHEGERYHGSRLRMSKERVERLGYFNQGEVVFNSITRKDKTNVVDLEVNVKERSTGTVSLGMGYGSVQKFFLTAQIAEINLFGNGQNLSLSGQYSSDRRSRTLTLGFTEPYLFDTEWSGGGDLYFRSFPIPGRYLQFQRGFNFRFGHPLQDDLNLYLTYRFENLRLEEVNSAVDPTIDTGPDIGNLSSIGASLINDKRNNRFETSSGHYEGVSSEWAGIGANKHFAKLVTEMRGYVPLTSGITFRTKGEVGQMFQTRSDRAIPPSEKFFLGGPNNLKGFDLFSVSPKSRFGVPLGGT